ncbi:MAG: ADP-ribosylation factor-like protein [Promethearchaeota archaeon]
MSEWVTTDEITNRLGYKILLAGLSEAGKTAVKRIFFLKQRTEDVDNISATLNYERLILNIEGTPITIVDLGGQRVFLKRFLGSFSPFIFNGVKAFIFLIDVENKTTRNNALQYYAGCVEKLQMYSPDAQFFVFLHKNDLVQHLPNYESIHEQLKDQFRFHTSPLNAAFFRTTIYRPESVIDAFGRIIELAMPDLAESEYVHGRTIGEIEEYAVMFQDHVVTREPIPLKSQEVAKAVSPQAPATSAYPVTASRASIKASGDPAILAKLQGLMQASVKTEVTPGSSPKTPESSDMLSRLQGLMRASVSTEPTSLTEPKPQPIPFLSNAAEEETVTETDLIPVAEMDVTPKILPTQAPPVDDTAVEQLTALMDSYDSKESTIESKMPPVGEPVHENERVNHLINFFGLPLENAVEIVNSGYADAFEVAATSRIPLPLVLNMILKYIPYIESEGLNIATINDDRLLEIFFAHLTDLVKEDNLLKCLTLAAERPSMSIEEIAHEFLIEPEIKAAIEEEDRLKPIPTKTRDRVQLSIPVETESDDGIMIFPDSPGIGFKAEITEELNCNLHIYQQGHYIGKSLVSSAISIEELMYLLYYELQLPFEGGVVSVNFAARIISSTIQKLLDQKLAPAAEVDTLYAALNLLESDKVQLELPFEVEAEDDYLILPDSQGVAFKVEEVENELQLKFKQRELNIGQLAIRETPSEHQTLALIREVMLLPIESGGAFEFAARVITAAIQTIKDEGVVSSALIKKYIPEGLDSTSETMKRFIKALEILDD